MTGCHTRTHTQLLKLDLIFGKEPDKIDFQVSCSTAKTDHAVVEFEISQKRMFDSKAHKIGRNNYGKADHESMRTFF